VRYLGLKQTKLHRKFGGDQVSDRNTMSTTPQSGHFITKNLGISIEAAMQHGFNSQIQLQAGVNSSLSFANHVHAL